MAALFFLKTLVTLQNIAKSLTQLPDGNNIAIPRVHLNGGQIIWSQKIIRPPDCCQKIINLFRMQKLELLISSLSNADELAFKKKFANLLF